MTDECEDYLKDHPSKCRCCFKRFKDDEKINISKAVESKFLSVIQIELRASKLYSQSICRSCSNTLDEFNKFKRDVFERQSRLYAFCEPTSANQLTEVFKTEADISLEDIKLESQYSEEEFDNIEILQESIIDPSDSKGDEDFRNGASYCNDVESIESDRGREQCVFCQKWLRPSAMKRHINVVHFGIREYICSECGYKADTNGRLNDHHKAVHEEKERDTNVSRAKRRKHKPASGEKKVCPECGSCVVDLTKHLRRTHSNIINFICDFCGYATMLRFRFLKHMRNRHLPKEMRARFKCRYCEFTSVDKSYLRTHEKTHENPEIYRCQCTKEFSNKHLLAAHQKIVHERVFKHSCIHCPKSYPNKVALKEHIVTQHTKKDIRNEICKICNKSFITKSQLKSHIKECHTEGTFRCDYEGCAKAFHKVSQLNRHNLTHTQEKNYTCDLCANSYVHASHLFRHREIVHVGVKIFCEISGCSASFVRKDNYRAHILKTHRNLDPSSTEKILRKIRDMKVSASY